MASASKRRKKKKTASAKRSTTRPAAKRLAKARGAEIAPAEGPVTLEEAKALARAARPKLALAAARETAAPPTSPADVADERQKLERARREEFARRIQEYKATMEIMKKRGARRSRSKKAGLMAVAREADLEGESFTPLQIFAEGDSWFDYPVPFFGGGIIPRLETQLGVPILNLAKAGDEVRYMLGVEERILLTDQLRTGSPAGGPWDVLLFSGGGNDIVDNPMALWIKDWDPTMPPGKHINQPRFDTALALVRAGYEDLIALRDKFSPGTHLVFQGYDFAIPDGRGICGHGPWLKPALDLHNFPTQAAGQGVVKAMLLQFAAMLQSLAAHPKISFINTQGTLAPQTSSWHNELHPAKAGFNKFAAVFYKELKKLFPARVA